jgi:flagellin
MSDITLSKAVRTNLLSLQSTAELMAKTQERLATGNKVNSALDNPTNFFTASSLNSRASDLNALMDNMSNGIKTLQAADNGLTAITKTLESMQSTLRQARQDKSFQNNVYEVTADSVITVNGGQFDLPAEIKLGVATPGRAAAITTEVINYIGPTSDAASSKGVGERTLMHVGSAGLPDGSKILVDGLEISIANPTPTSLNSLAIDIQAKLNSSALAGKYTVTEGIGVNANKLIFETTAVGEPRAELTAGSSSVSAVKAATTFKFNDIVGSVTVGGAVIETGAVFDTFVDNLNTVGAEANPPYRAIPDTGAGTISLEALNYGDAAPLVANLAQNQPAVAATTTFDLTGMSVTAPTGSITVTGLAAPVSVADTDPDIPLAIHNAILGAFAGPPANANYQATGTYPNLTITALASGQGAAPTLTLSDVSAPLSEVPTVGLDAVTNGYDPTPAIDGLYFEDVEAATHTFSVSYDNKNLMLSIPGIKGGIGTSSDTLETMNWRSATLSQLNADLKNGGITGVEAKFASNGALTISAINAEEKTLVVYGGDTYDLFGTDTVNTGSAKIDGYSAKTPVDKFVEEINLNYAGKLRASNDNGKLRIENLSTAELAVQFDQDGSGPISTKPSTINGNSVRDNLSLQFNDLKNQLDRLSDDASFNGINLLRGDNLKITFNENGSSFIDVQTTDGRGINASALRIENLIGRDLDTDEGIDGLLNDIKLALSDIRSQASKFGSNLSIVQNRQDFTKNMINTLETGAANLTLADMNEEAANLLALQTRQSLSSSSLSLASQADQSVLQLLQ